jgi:hypothetical protein
MGVHVESLNTLATLAQDGVAPAAVIPFLFPKMTPVSPCLTDIKEAIQKL